MEYAEKTYKATSAMKQQKKHDYTPNELNWKF